MNETAAGLSAFMVIGIVVAAFLFARARSRRHKQKQEEVACHFGLIFQPKGEALRELDFGSVPFLRDSWERRVKSALIKEAIQVNPFHRITRYVKFPEFVDVVAAARARCGLHLA